MNDSAELRGLGGWLILVGIGVVLTPLRLGYFVTSTYYPLFADGTWAALGDSSSSQYIPYFALYLQFELACNLLILLVSLAMVFLFFTKRRMFPRVYIGIAVFSMIFLLADLWIFSLFFPAAELFDADTLQELARGLFTLCIWVPYMLLSKRVRATFVNPQSKLAQA